jgi:nucleotide-binding universal stress UspA family protein
MKILFTTDGSPHSDVVLSEACRLLPVAGAEGKIVSVLDPLVFTAGYEGMAPASALVMDREAQALERALGRAQAILASHGLHAGVEELEGEPATVILEAAAGYQPDIIVMGSHGRGPLGRLVLGSVSDKVLHSWPGAVLIIRPQA